LKWGKIETTPAKLAIGSLVLKIVVTLISVPIVVLLGHTDIVADLKNVSFLVVLLVLSGWFFIAKSKLSMVGICVCFVLDAIGTVVVLPSLPRELWLGTAAGGVVAVVGLVSGIYCLSTWSTSIPNNVKVLKVFE
jgi:hypothetical protein